MHTHKSVAIFSLETFTAHGTLYKFNLQGLLNSLCSSDDYISLQLPFITTKQTRLKLLTGLV